MSAPFEKVTVAGLGLIGASFAGAFKAAYPESTVYGIESNPDALASALSRGLVDQGCTPDDDQAMRDLILDSDLVLISTPVDQAPKYFQLLADLDYKGVVTDTCSTKNKVAALAAEILPHANRYIPGHPMAGSEKSGVNAARSDLFKNAHWVLCPDESTRAEDFARLHDMLIGLEARVVSLPRESHDGAVAIVSHVPHFTASSLVELAVRHADDQEALFRLAAGGFKDSTRIAAGSPMLWTGIAFDNAEAIVAGLHEARDILGEYEDALASGDRDALRALLERAAAARRSIPAKWVPATEDMLEVRIPMTNRKGIVAEVTTIASQAGCNIQSIEIDHITSSTAELVLLLTDEGDVGKLSTQLIKAGFSISFNPLFAKEQDDG